MTTKLSGADYQFLKLVQRSPVDAEGWAECSKMLWPIAVKIPDALLDKLPVGDAGSVRLTAEAKAVLQWR